MKSSGSRVFFVLATALGLFGLVLFSGLAAYVWFARDLPPAEQLGQTSLNQSSKIFDRNGALLFEVFDPQGGKRTIIQPDQVPTVVKDATISTEDPSFYTNMGVDPIGVVRAIYYDIRYGGAVVGGSTITQQLIKNSLLSPERSLTRKVKEAILAVEVTRRYSKDQILAFYLNSTFYGNLAYGIQAAAQAYFNKDVSQLDLAEASLLAGIPQAPALYDPCTDSEAALSRQAVVLKLMVENQKITQAQADAATSEMRSKLNDAQFTRQCAGSANLKAPHWVNYVRAQLEQQYGPEVLYKGGLQVTTTYDPKIQAIAEDEARKQVAALTDKNVTNAAVVVVDPKSGEIMAMVGSVDFNNTAQGGQVNVADRLRQPGSSIKPINYVTAFKKGWTPATTIYDLPTNFGGNPPYVPLNYDLKYHGQVTVRTALANSLNIPAVKTLDFVTVPDMINTARQLGITTFQDPSRYGLALTLGGGEVKLVELTGAFVAFADNGARIPATPYLKILDGSENTLYDLNGKDKPRAACAQFDPNTPNEQPDANNQCPHSAPYAYLITSILSDNNARALEFGLNSPLKTSFPTAVKTGTTNDFRDNWTVGYSTDWVVGVWVGNNNNSAMKDVSGISGAAPIWHNVMERLAAGKPPADFQQPAGVTRITVCAESGLPATDLCPADHRHQELAVADRIGAKDNVWQRPPNCSEVYMVPPHDVADVIPYPQIVAWAKQSGWKVPPSTDLKSCAAAPTPGTPASSPTVTPTPSPELTVSPSPKPTVDVSPTSAATSTPVPPTATTILATTTPVLNPSPTGVIVTGTPPPLPTNTQAPISSSTPLPAPSNTSVPAPTNTSAPPTNTPVPPATNTPAPANTPPPAKTPPPPPPTKRPG